MTSTCSFPLPDFLATECARIVPLAEKDCVHAQKRLDSLTKPLGSLGRLEDMARRLYAIQQSEPLKARPARMFTIAADHGVVAEGVASSPKAVTLLMVRNFLAEGAAINALCAASGADMRVVDAGVDADPLPPHPLLISAKIARGSKNIAQGPAMSTEECEKAIALGISLAQSAKEEGIRVVGTGEMGIGNTTPSSALFCAFFGFSAQEMTGMGAGVPPAGLAHKSAVIQKALAVNAQAVASGNPLTILAALGGIEIAALSGLILGAAARRMAVMVDGFIATAAYAAASRIAPAVKEYCYFCHGSAEAGHKKALEALDETALLDLGMRLGEGTGAALGMGILHAAATAYNNMASFDSAGIDLDA